MAFAEALKTLRLIGNAPVDLVLDANIGIHVFFFLATVCTGNRAGSSDGYLPYPYLDDASISTVTYMLGMLNNDVPHRSNHLG